MLTFVLRLHRAELATGKLVGEVEAVASGRRFIVRSPEELLRTCLAAWEGERLAVDQRREAVDDEP